MPWTEEEDKILIDLIRSSSDILTLKGNLFNEIKATNGVR